MPPPRPVVPRRQNGRQNGRWRGLVAGAATRIAARGKPLVPDRAWPVILTLRSAMGPGPLVADPTMKRVIVLAAHPDDESLGCAGTLALLRGAGADVTIAFATNGEATRGAAMAPAAIAELRRSEAAAACAELDVHDLRFWDLPDGGLVAELATLTLRVADLVREKNADGLLLPWFLDGHPDHEALGAALAAADLPAELDVWGYETWTPLPANRIVDITPVIDRKRAAIAAHPTAALAFELEAGLGLNRWRSIHGLMGRGYAEGFLVASAPEWVRLRARALA